MVEDFDVDTVERGQVLVEKNSVASKDQNHAFDLFERHEFGSYHRDTSLSASAHAVAGACTCIGRSPERFPEIDADEAVPPRFSRGLHSWPSDDGNPVGGGLKSACACNGDLEATGLETVAALLDDGEELLRWLELKF